MPGRDGEPHGRRRAHARRWLGLAQPAARVDDRQPGIGAGRAGRRPPCVPGERDRAPDLFWALRGGGGNFGVVTEFEFRLHEVGPIVQFAMLFVEQDRAAHALRAARDVVERPRPRPSARGSPASVAPPAPFVPAEHHFAPVVALILVGFGDRGGARGRRRGRASGTAAAVRGRHAHAVRRTAADARRGRPVGHPLLHEGPLPRRAARRGDRRCSPSGCLAAAPAIPRS